MRSQSFPVVLLIAASCGWLAPAVLLNAPPEFDQAHVYIDDRHVGDLKATHNYRWGTFATQNEMGAPPRYEANLAIEKLPLGVHRLRIAKDGYAEYRATFRNRLQHVEIFVVDDAARKFAPQALSRRH